MKKRPGPTGRNARPAPRRRNPAKPQGSARQAPAARGTGEAGAYRDAARGIRLQKAMAELGVASRRDCEVMIEAGRVSVNGDIIRELPAWVDPQQDVIELDGQRVNRPNRGRRRDAAGPVRHTYVMVHKPRSVISTNEDPEGRKRVIDLIDADLPGNPRLFPVGRLDADSTGLILLTDDGELANHLTHPRYEVTKTYEVSVRGRVSEDDLDRLRKGLYLADRRPAKPQAAKRAAVEQARIVGRQVDRERGDRTLLQVTLREGQNREIRRLMARLGFKVRRLKRVAIGPLKLKGLAVGQWRLLSALEVGMLRKAASGQPA